MINEIIEMVFKPGSEYDKVLDNLIFKYKVNKRRKGELISIISMNWLERPTNIIKVYQNGSNDLLKYYNNSIVNQITGYPKENKGGGSEFNRNSIKDKEQISEKYMYILEDDMEYVIDNDNKITKGLEILFECIENCGLTKTEKNIFLNYIRWGQNYSILTKCYGKSKTYLWENVSRSKKKILIYYEKNF